MKKYEHIFFDLDHTLWDFSTNCAETLSELYNEHRLQNLGISAEEFIVAYRTINDKMWADFHHGKTTKEEIRDKRFLYTFELLKLKSSDIPEGIDNQFLEICPTKSHVFPHTFDVLNYLSENYILHILTNGFSETQFIKVKSAKLDPYFEHVIHSEMSGHLKPDKRMFDYALNKANAKAQQSIMIGDDLFADVLGAKNAGIAQVFVNRNNEQHSETITHEVDCLSTLKTFL
jgi:putative hydrolase of the HAD superfamily